jgi:3-oxoacid CoA-transferase subunit B
MNPADQVRLQIARRAAREIPEGAYINLGIGIPLLIQQFLSPKQRITVMTESGLLGVGPRSEKGDPDLISASKENISLLAGSAIFSSEESFAIIRGGHLDLSILGAFEVDEQGNLANWMIPGKLIHGMGGAMDLAVGARRVVVAMRQTRPDHTPKIVRRCTHPLTAVGVVQRIITEKAVFDVTPGGLLLKELTPEMTMEEIAQMTAAEIRIDKDLQLMQV